MPLDPGPSRWRSPSPDGQEAMQNSIGVGRTPGPSARMTAINIPFQKTVGVGRTPSLSPSPFSSASTPLHIFQGAFPSQMVAMKDVFYLQPLNVIVVEDITLRCSHDMSEKKCRMLKDETIPHTWLYHVKQSFPDFVFPFPANNGSDWYAYWEWVSDLSSKWFCTH